MDLAKTPNEEKVLLSRIYFIGGFAFLPFLWFINTIWFFRDAFRKEEFEGQLDIRKYVIRSAIGTVIWTAGLTAWITIYQLHRAQWGELGDKLSFLIPLGEA